MRMGRMAGHPYGSGGSCHEERRNLMRRLVVEVITPVLSFHYH